MPSDDARIRSLRSQIALWGRVMHAPGKPAWQVALAGRTIAELQAELEALDGTQPSITLADCEEYEAATREANRRVIAGEVPQFSNQANIRGEYRRRERVAETELVSHPTEQALRQRKAARTSASPAALPLGGFDGGGSGPMAYASETGNLCDTRPAFQRRPTHLSGRSAD